MLLFSNCKQIWHKQKKGRVFQAMTSFTCKTRKKVVTSTKLWSRSDRVTQNRGLTNLKLCKVSSKWDHGQQRYDQNASSYHGVETRKARAFSDGGKCKKKKGKKSRKLGLSLSFEEAATLTLGKTFEMLAHSTLSSFIKLKTHIFLQ